jgi:hypothetical protein
VTFRVASNLCSGCSTGCASTPPPTGSGLPATWSIAARIRSAACAWCAISATARSACSATTTCTCWRWPPAPRRCAPATPCNRCSTPPTATRLLDWLRHRPLLHHDPALGYTLAHAGLAPDWDLATARACAGEVEAALRSASHPTFLRAMYGNTPERWDPALAGIERQRYAVNALTRMRYIAADGRLLFQPKGPPGSQPAGARPWFQSARRAHAGLRIVFGHWSSLGRVHWPAEQVWCLDTGCLWGHRLTALALETGELRHCEC